MQLSRCLYKVGRIAFTLDEKALKELGKEFSDERLLAWDLAHHEGMHSVLGVKIFKNGKIVRRIDFVEEVKRRLKSEGWEVSNIPNRYTPFENQALDLLTLRANSYVKDRARFDMFEKAYIEFVEGRRTIKAILSGNIDEVKAFLSTDSGKAYAAEWLVLKRKEAKETLTRIVDMAPELKGEFAKVEHLAKVYKEAMNIV